MKNLNIIKTQKETKEIYELPFELFLKQVESPSWKIRTEEDKDKVKANVPYVYGCEFVENTFVKSENVIQYNYIIADFDNANLQNRIAFLESFQINYVLYTSINHKIKGERDRFRVVLPLSSPISQADWMILSRKIKGSSALTSSPIFAEVDQSSFSSNRGFCFPVLTQTYFSKVSLGGMNISLSTFEAAYNISKKEIEKQERFNLINADISRSLDDSQKIELFKENLLSELANMEIDWSRDGVNGQKAIGTNNIISRIIGKLVSRGLSYSEILSFRNDISTSFSFQHKKEWEYCAKKFSRACR